MNKWITRGAAAILGLCLVAGGLIFMPNILQRLQPAEIPASEDKVGAGSSEEETLDLGAFRELLSRGDLSQALSYLKDNAPNFGRESLSTALTEYCATLLHSLPEKTAALQGAAEGSSLFQSLFTPGGITVADLNDLDFLNQETSLPEDPELKQLLRQACSQGLKVRVPEGMLEATIDYQALLDTFSGSITDELAQYFKIRATESNQPALVDAALTIDWDELAKRLAAIEDFERAFPNSQYKLPLSTLQRSYLASYIFGANNTPSYSYESKIVKPEVLKSYEQTLETYPDYRFTALVRDYKAKLAQNESKVNDHILAEMHPALDHFLGAVQVESNTITKEEDTIVVNQEIPVVYLPNNPALAEEVNQRLEEAYVWREEIEAQLQDYLAAAEENDFPVHPFQVHSSYLVTYNMNNLLSIATDHYQYTGGATV
jgi:hypothetical protein